MNAKIQKSAKQNKKMLILFVNFASPKTEQKIKQKIHESLYLKKYLAEDFHI